MTGSKYYRLANGAIYLATFFILADVNTILNLVFDIRAPISPLILILVLIALPSLFKTESGFQTPIKLFVLFLGLYLTVASFSALIYLDEHHPILFDENEHLLRIRGYLTTILVVITYYYFTKRKVREKKLFSFLHYCGWIFIIVTVFTPLSEYLDLHQYYKNPVIDNYARMTGLSRGVVDAGLQANVGLLFLLFFILNKWARRNILYILMTFLMLYSSLVTFSKAAIIGSAFLLMVFLISVIVPMRSGVGAMRLVKRAWPVNFFIAVLLSLSFVLPGVLVTYYDNLERSQQERLEDAQAIVQGEISDETTSARNSVALEGLRLIGERPFFGTGLASFHRLPQNGVGVHNTYLMILGESGFVPFFLMIVFIAVTSYKAFKLYGEDRLLGFLVMGTLLIVFVQLMLPTHTALLDRKVNVLLAISLALLSFKRWSIANYQELEKGR